MKKSSRSLLFGAVQRIFKTLGPVRCAEIFRDALKGDPDDVQKSAEQFIMTLLPTRPWSDGFERDVLHGQAVSGTPLSVYVADEQKSRLLDEIPSETTRAERRFLYTFFKSIWSGRGDVFEVGPFLGGTTRAIALGMMENPCREKTSRFLTFDKFKEYHPVDDLGGILKPYFAARGLDDAAGRELIGDGHFLDVFRRIHRDQAYSAILVEKDHVLPDWPGEENELPNAIKIDAECCFHAAFIDGCKSWYGTRYCMKMLAPHIPAGGYLLFQDYGWYTCFWLPSFIGLSGVKARLFGYVDNTYVFQLMDCMDADAIDKNFPDTPEKISPRQFSDLFNTMVEDAIRRDDQRAVISLQLQLGAALAYTGHADDAIRCLDRVAAMPLSARYRGMVKDARLRPTYNPPGRGGDVVLPAP